MKQELLFVGESNSEIERASMERFYLSAAENLETGGRSIGEGKTAVVSILENHPDICVKTINAKKKKEQNYVNDLKEEMRFLDYLNKKNIRAPKPQCVVKTEKDYMFMETIDGFTCGRLIDENKADRLPANFDFNLFFKKVKEMLEKMHAQNLHHRDLHADNLMIDKDGEPVIIDFGDAKFNYLSSEDPYRDVVLGKTVVYTDDNAGLQHIRAQVGAYLKQYGYFDK